jgi:hypothetical protein
MQPGELSAAEFSGAEKVGLDLFHALNNVRA